MVSNRILLSIVLPILAGSSLSHAMKEEQEESGLTFALRTSLDKCRPISENPSLKSLGLFDAYHKCWQAIEKHNPEAFEKNFGEHISSQEKYAEFNLSLYSKAIEEITNLKKENSFLGDARPQKMQRILSSIMMRENDNVKK